MADQTYRISGSVIHHTTGKGVAGLRVEAWDKDLIFNDLVGSAITDAQGKFQIEFTEAHFRGIFFDRRPDLFFKVFDGGHPINTTEDSIRWNLNTPYQEVKIKIDGATVGQPGSPPYELRGVLTIQAGVPPAKARLTAFTVSFDDPIGTPLNEDPIVISKSAEWSIPFDFFAIAGPGTSPQTFRPHLRFEVVRTLLGGGKKKHDLLRFNADLSQRFTLILPNSYYPEIERVKRARKRLSASEENAIRHQIVAAEEGVPEEAFDVYDQALAEGASTGLPLEVAYAFVRVRALATKPNLPDDEALLRFAIERGYVGDEVVGADYLEEVRAWRQRKKEAEEAERQRLAKEQAEQEQEQLKAKIAAEEGRKEHERREREERARRASERLLRPNESGAISALGEILKSVNLPDDAQLAYARVLLDGRGASDVEVDERLKAAKVPEEHRDTIQRVRRLMGLIGDHPPLFKYAWQELQNASDWNPKRPDLSAFAQKTADAWQVILAEKAIDPPEAIRGNSDEERRRAYARMLELQFDRLYPDEAMATRLIGTPELEAVGRLLTQHSTLKTLRTQSIPTDLLRSNDQDAQHLRRFQRLIRVAPASEAVRLFAQTGLSSAAEIAAMSSATFVKRAKEAGIDEARANHIHHQAIQRSAQTLAVIANIAPGLNTAKPRAVVTPSPGSASGESSDTSANMDTLFGAEGACAVQECQSVLGMPAYFFDLLEEVRHNGAGVNLLDDVLFTRRRDLGEIELSCKNSETRLPYVDLVNEILERAVVNEASPESFPQTTWEEDDLAASPEHLDATAYETLRLADYPWSLPFSLAHEEARTYLAHLGTSLVRLMELLNPPSSGNASSAELRKLAHINRHTRESGYPVTSMDSRLRTAGMTLRVSLQSSTSPGALRLAGEYLGMTSREVGYFTKPPTSPTGLRLDADPVPQSEAEAPFWGFEQNRTINWSGDAIQNVRVFMDVASVSWLELLELMLSDYINPGHALNPFTDSDQTAADAPVRIKLGKDACDLHQAKLVSLQVGFLRRFRLFVRLWRRLGWTVRELDRAISIFEGDLRGDSFIAIANIQRLRDSFQLPVETILSWFGEIDVQVRWDRQEGGSEWPSPRQPSQFERLFLDKSTLAATQRDSLGKALNVGPSEPLLLSKEAGTIRAVLGLSDADLHLLTDAATFAEMVGVQPALSRPGENWSNVFVETDELTVGNLSRLFRMSTLARVLRLSIPELLKFRAITGIDPFSAPQDTLDFSVALDRQRAAGVTVAELDYILRDRGQLSQVAANNREAAMNRLTVALEKAQPDGKFQENQNNVVCSIVAKHFCTPTRVVTTVFEQFEAQNLSPSQFATSLLSETNDQSAAHDTYYLLEKAVYAIRKLCLVADESSFPIVSDSEQLRPCAAVKWKELLELPIEGPHENWLRFMAWRSVVDLVHVRDRLAAQNVSLWQVREAARKEAAGAASPTEAVTASWQAASALLGVRLTDLLELDLLSVKAHLLNGTQWRRVIDALELVRTLGVSVSTAKAWVSRDTAAPGTEATAGEQGWLTFAEALEIRNAARARHDAQSWKKVARELRDPLREKQRRALVAYLCARDRAASTAMKLYEKYLVDVEMGAQQDTTRIELAVASVQLFIQRVLLGQEKLKQDGKDVTLSFDASFARRWEWMKRYESWANSRRVFLYPENYLRPDLRADKSPLFIEAEEAMAQRELNQENIEEIVADYVLKLNEIARLEVMGTAMEEREDSEGMLYRLPLLHIVARTNGQPQVYYHRTWNRDTGLFTAWKKIDLSIDGDWVFPIVRDGRLTLYWIRHEKDMESLKDTVGLTSTQPFPLQPHLPMFQDQYRLSWSSFYRGKWTPKKTAEQLIARPFLPFTETKFAVRVVGDRVRISGLTVPQTDIAKSFSG